MRTQEEIKARLINVKEDDVLGFEWVEYAKALTPESLESLKGTVFKKDADVSGWDPPFKSDKDIRKQCIDYMKFAWEKAKNCRGISAYRSLAHYRAWLWLLGSDNFDRITFDYEYYGKNELVQICRFLGLDPGKYDDGIRRNSEED